MRGVVNNLCEIYPAQPGSVRMARHRLTDFAAAAGATEQQLEAVRLASSEALTNAAVHAYRGHEGSIQVTAALVSNELWVLIADDGCGLEPHTDRPGLGLGLGLIAQLTDHLAIAPRASGGTEVRMRFNLVGTDRAGANQIRRQREHRPSARIGNSA
ncbi:MAG TPA: ATP-binding protein [Solirubrobacteraceae bacterium]|jgi:stage II sporulation protein AB (anti-sigma F factor)